MPRKPVDTASPHQSIWRTVGSDTFRRNLVALEHATNNLPDRAKANCLDSWLSRRKCEGVDDSSRRLSLQVEQQLVDDFSFLAAFEVGTNAVSAAAVEERHDPDGLILRLAANDGINQATNSFFQRILDDLKKCATRATSIDTCQDSIFKAVVAFGRKRIRNRLSLRTGQLADILEQNASTYPLLSSSGPGLQAGFAADVKMLCASIRQAEGSERRSAAEISALGDMVTKIHAFCSSNGRNTLRETIFGYGIDYSEIRSREEIRCLDKIGRYLGSCIYLANAARKYAPLFAQIELVCEEPYRFLRSSISTDVTPSSHAEGVECLVHAEIQLVTHYELRNKDSASHKTSTAQVPRCIGSSKAACFLCNLFVHEHGRFFLAKTHGRIYDRWIVPDLASYSRQTVQRYRDVLSALDLEMRNRVEVAKGEPGVYLARQEPLHSWISLQDSPLFAPAELSKSKSLMTGRALAVRSRSTSGISTRRLSDSSSSSEDGDANWIRLQPRDLRRSSFKRTLDRARPLRLSIGRLLILFESDDDGETVPCRLTLKNPAVPSDLDIFNLSADEVQTVSTEERDGLNVSLCYGSQAPIRIRLKILS